MISSIILESIYKKTSQGDFSLCIDNAEFRNDNISVIVGPNGSGKSTLLKIIALMNEPDKGRILFDNGNVLQSMDDNKSLKRKIGFIMQNPYLFNMDVFGNVAIGLKIRKYPKREIISKVKDILGILEISHLANRNIRYLSGGERQKVAIAQVLIFEPEIILMDEPTANIDFQSELFIEDRVKNIQKTLRSILILTTHSFNQAYRMSSNIISMNSGKIMDFVYENVFFGNLSECTGGLKCMNICPGVVIIISTEKSGKLHIAIDPSDIIISREATKTSARNCFKGEVVKIESLGCNVRLFVDIGVNIYVLITKQSFEDMGINIGSNVFVSFKVNSVKVI